MLYFLRVGGLTWQFNLGEPVNVIPVPVPWLVALIAIVAGLVVLQLVALLRGRWTVPTWLVNTLLQLSLIHIFILLDTLQCFEEQSRCCLSEASSHCYSL